MANGWSKCSENSYGNLVNCVWLGLFVICREKTMQHVNVPVSIETMGKKVVSNHVMYM